MEKLSVSAKGRRSVFFEDGRRRSGSSFFVPLILTLDTLIFVITMYVNDCPGHGGGCVLRFLGRLSFQPMHDNPLLGPSSSTLLRMGGLSYDTVAHDHQLWRLFTCIWLHAGLIHLLVNGLSLLFIGIRLEQEFGSGKIGIIYVLSGIGGSMLAEIFLQHQISVGSSASLFGLLGAVFAELLAHWSLYTMKCATVTSLILVAVVNLVIGMLPHADNFAHIGGFLFGFLLGFVFLTKPEFGWGKQDSAPQVREVTNGTFTANHAMYRIFLWAAAIILLAVG